MSRLNSVDDLKKAREKAQKEIETRQETGTRIFVGMGTCGIAAGAKDVMDAILAELKKWDIEAEVTGVGCIGMCVKEPLVDIQRGNGPRVTYGGITPEKVPQLIEEHLVRNNIIKDWVVGKLG
jgi:NADP-reducing hydrogenase subunit HndB